MNSLHQTSLTNEQLNKVRPSSNIHFNPLPTVSGKCPKCSISISLSSTLYVAGEILSGRLELHSSTKTELFLGEIYIELIGFQRIYLINKRNCSQKLQPINNFFEATENCTRSKFKSIYSRVRTFKRWILFGQKGKNSINII
jgi:hypothetical protein